MNKALKIFQSYAQNATAAAVQFFFVCETEISVCTEAEAFILFLCFQLPLATHSRNTHRYTLTQKDIPGHQVANEQ